MAWLVQIAHDHMAKGQRPAGPARQAAGMAHEYLGDAIANSSAPDQRDPQRIAHSPCSVKYTYYRRRDGLGHILQRAIKWANPTS
jgi:hypothetical protein